MKFFSLAIFSLLIFTAGHSPTKYAEITFESEVFDFGTVKEGTIVETEFKFTNTGDVPLTIYEFKTACYCQKVIEWPKKTIKVGEKGVLRTTFNTKGFPGKHSKYAYLNANIQNLKKVLKIVGTVN